ncbi:MAG: sugar ABC transporter ATP-binding protein [Gordonia sp. (in: high G+C Gram-positive bacteria)]
MTPPLLPAPFAVDDLRKSYGGIPVLRGVDLRIEPGEIHALLGANGAGKSTLIKCVSGAEKPDSGNILIGGRCYRSLTPRQARQAGVAVIHQQPALAESLNVADNIFLGNEPCHGPIRSRRHAKTEAAKTLALLGASFPADANLRDLGNGELALVEIAKALVTHPRLVILDEPTAALTEREVQKLTTHMHQLRSMGIPILFITHRLTEALEIADEITVLRNGRCVVSEKSAMLTRDDLVRAIIDPARSPTAAASRSEREHDLSSPDTHSTPALFESHNLCGARFGPISLRVQRGEVIGLYGLVGAGRTEYLETIAGVRKSASGSIIWSGTRLSLRRPADAVSAGIALVPSDRLRESVFADLSGADNLLLPRTANLAWHSVIRSRRHESQIFDETALRLDLRPHSPQLTARRFSGGNQQKLVLGRWLNRAGQCDLLLLDEPTDGVDIGARGDLYTAIDEFVASGGAVIIASSEPDELTLVAHRVIVLARGRIAGIIPAENLSEHSLLRLAHHGE